MEVVKEFNGLNGCRVTREELEKMYDNAIENEQFLIADRINAVLKFEADRFDVELETPAFEQLRSGLMGAFEIDPFNEEQEGLNKAVSPNDILDMITKRMLEMIEASTKSYQKKWKDTGYVDGADAGKFLVPLNFVSKKPYRGINYMMLSNMGRPLENPYYLTFKQVSALKGKVKKGAIGKEVIYYTKLFTASDKEKGKSISSYDRQKVEDFSKENEIPEDKISSYAMLKYYNVFNGSDVEDIDFKLDQLKTGLVLKNVEAKEDLKFPVAEAMIANYPKVAPKMEFHGQRAFYSPGSDKVVIPVIQDFDTMQDYYRTFFHELAHSTGHSKRLSRDFSGKFGSPKYAKEELVAEFAAVFLSAESGIIWYDNHNHAAYLKSWGRTLKAAKDDNKFFISGAAHAQKAYDFVLDFDEKGNPAYFKDIAKFEKEKEEKALEKAKAKTKKETETSSVGVATTEKTRGASVSESKKEDPVKVDKNGQMALFGANKLKASVPAVPAAAPVPTIGNIKSISDTGKVESSFFKVNGATGEFLQAVERKSVGSVVITLDGMQGAGKTTTLYQFIEDFASAGNKCLFISGEEHPESSLAVEKRDKYLSKEAIQNTSIVAEVESIEQLAQYIDPFEIIFIDSWQKLQRMVGNIRLDEDLRKKFNGKVFVCIFQQTTTGRAKGGAEIVFDGDIIIKMIKEASFADNYAYFDKNRYTKIPIENIRYNIASRTCYNPNEVQDQEQPEEINLTFTPIIY